MKTYTDSTPMPHNNFTVNVAADIERKRGDCYRRRALCLLKLAQLWQRTNNETMESEQEWSALVERQLDAAREHAAISIARAAEMGLRAEAAEAEVARLREKCYYAELSDSAHAAVRELLMAHDVPMAAFIDDHVCNAIVQRNQARERGDEYFEKLLVTTVELTDANVKLAAAESRAARLAGLLGRTQKYSQKHEWECNSNHGDNKPCDCGVFQLWIEIAVILAARPQAAVTP